MLRRLLSILRRGKTVAGTPVAVTPQSRVVASFPPGLSPEEHRRLVERAKLLHELMEREHR